MSPSKHAKKAPAGDWHPADIKAALEKAGWSLRRLSTAAGLHPTTAKKALVQQYPNCERLIADALGVAPRVIWPSRYDAQGRPKRVSRRSKKDTTDDSQRNVKEEATDRHDRQAA